MLELRRRGHSDFLITLEGRVVMTSAAHRSEVALAELACEALRPRRRPRVLVGGLGMGFTLRAALDALPPAAHVTMAELNPVVVKWCRGPMAVLSDGALADPRVEVVVGDVADVIREAEAGSWDAIALDLYEGPRTRDHHDPHFGSWAVERAHRALRPGGVLAVWSEQPDRRFEKLLSAAGFSVSHKRPGRGGLRHAVTLAVKAEVREGASRGGRPRGSAGRRRSSGR